MRVVSAVAFSLVVFASPAPAVEQLGMPAGWIDLSPGAPEGNFASVPASFAEAARMAKATQFAVEPISGDQLPSMFLAFVEPKALNISPPELDSLANNLLTSRRERDPAARIVGKEFTHLGAVEAMHAEVEYAAGERAMRTSMFQVPLGNRTVFISYVCERSGCDRIRNAVSAALRGVRAEDSQRYLVARSQLIASGITLAVVVGAATLVWRKRRRQRKAMPN